MKNTDKNIPMTDEQLRIRVAELCGKKPFWCGNGARGKQELLYESEKHTLAVVPDYPNDLNAMHEAEKVMTDGQFSRYGWLLLERAEGKQLECRAYLSATARKRAEALVKTMDA